MKLLLKNIIFIVVNVLYGIMSRLNIVEVNEIGFGNIVVVVIIRKI